MIVSTTLAGAGCAPIVGDALACVADLVDAFLVIDTADDGAALDAVRRVAGDRLRTARFPWADDFAAARNFALDEAARLGATWAVTVDPDERLHVDAAAMRRTLGSTSAACLLLPDCTGTYAKERFFRLPCPGRFTGMVHEAFPAYLVGAVALADGCFSELPKGDADVAAKNARDVGLLRRQIDAAPHDPRWRYYLGDTLERMGDVDGAVRAYAECVALRGWSEEAAWACYRAAHCEIGRGRHAEAVEWCGVGLARHPGMPELPWTAALAEWHAGRPAEAVVWARMAEALGDVRGCHASDGRIGFRHPPAAFEGPYDVLRYALRALGDDSGADVAEARYAEAIAMRTAR